MFLRVSSLRCASHVESNLAPCLPLPRPSTRCGVVNQQKAGLWRFGRLGEDGGGCVRCGATSPVLHNLPTLHNLPRGLQPSRPTSQYEKASPVWRGRNTTRSGEHTSELQSQSNIVCRLLLGKKKKDQ